MFSAQNYISILPSSRPQTLGMTCRTWLQAESSKQSCLARRHPRLPEVGVEKTPGMMGYSWRIDDSRLPN